MLWQRHGTGLARTTLDLGGDCPRRRAAASASCRRCSPPTNRRSASDFRANLPTARAAELGRVRSAQPRLSALWRCGSQAARARQCGHGFRVPGRMSAMVKGWRFGPWGGSSRRIQPFEDHVGRRIQPAQRSSASRRFDLASRRWCSPHTPILSLHRTHTLGIRSCYVRTSLCCREANS